MTSEASVPAQDLERLSPVFIANRGEIACRIVRTCRRLGLGSIAAYSDADAGARHVGEADRAVRIGPAEAARSYLDVEAVVAAALAAGARSLHPGYGFLSERAVLARRCLEAGLVWIGPRADVIEAMGSKIEAKRVAAAAGVAGVPGYTGDSQDPALLAREAAKIGFPILVKASGGGGGRGMRRVEDRAQFAEQLELARREAFSAFGDDRVLLERLVLRPRHLEVQVAGDRHGNVVQLLERECSLQRNYQKVIEEAPAAWLAPSVRERLHQGALRLAREIGYDSLGTVEFVIDEDSGEPYFLEMNTRLQVEHGVTEAITGLDLVELQLRIAAGQRLPITQADVRAQGWAIEARVACEDPSRGYRPQIGHVHHYREPSATAVRVDSGIGLHSEVTPYYDSMVAKLIAHAADRDGARIALEHGLREFQVHGVGTNQRFLRELLLHPQFARRPATTRFIDEAYPGGWSLPATLRRQMIAASALRMLSARAAAARADVWRHGDGLRMVGRGTAAPARFEVMLEDDAATEVSVALAPTGPSLTIGDDTFALVRCDEQADGITLQFAGEAAALVAVEAAHGEPRYVSVDGVRRGVRVRSRLAALGQGTGKGGSAGNEIRAVMPGIITAVQAVAGAQVRAGEALVTMEAMKLVYALAAPQDGRVREVLCKAGDTVSPGQRLVEIESTRAAQET